MNNLYDWGMSDYLPYGRFKWLKILVILMEIQSVKVVQQDILLELILNILVNKELHNDYPLAPGKLAITYDMLSDYCKKIAEKYGIKVGDVKKLIPNLGNKTNYVLRYKNYKLYLSLKNKLTKIHKVLKFKQSDWMKIYIDFNTKRKKKQMLLIVLKKMLLS